MNLVNNRSLQAKIVHKSFSVILGMHNQTISKAKNNSGCHLVENRRLMWDYVMDSNNYLPLSGTKNTQDHKIYWGERNTPPLQVHYSSCGRKACSNPWQGIRITYQSSNAKCFCLRNRKRGIIIGHPTRIKEFRVKLLKGNKVDWHPFCHVKCQTHTVICVTLVGR